MKRLIVVFSLIAFLASCSTTTVTRGKQYASLYEEAPTTIVIMPPINETDFVEAKELFYTTLYMPLCEKGYYVFSPYLTLELFQTESAYDSELFIEGDLTVIRNVLDADAAMFTIIKSWNRNVVGGTITVGVEYLLRSTKSGETLYHREGLITLDTGIDSGGEGWVSLLADLATSALNTALTDKIIAGRQCTAIVLSDLPAGKYSPSFGKDKDLPAGKSYIRKIVD